jgi:hypothetical protein
MEPEVVIATVGAVVYDLPVVVKATEPGSTDEPAIPIVAEAYENPG